MSALNNAKAESTDPIRGILNDVVDAIGFPRFEQFVGVPADIAHVFRVPTIHEAIPTPAEVASSVSRSLISGQAPRIPAPLLPSGPLPGPFDRSLMTPEGRIPEMSKGMESPFMAFPPMPPMPPLPGYAHGPYYQGMYYQQRKQ